MILKDKILVTSARRFEGEVEGKKHDFTKITYISLGEGVNYDNEKGFYPNEVIVGNSKVFEELSSIQFPAFYDASFDVVQTRKGPDIKLLDFTFVKSLELK